MVETLAPCTNPLLKTISQVLALDSLQTLSRAIEEIVSEDAALQHSALSNRNQKCYAVKSNVNGLLDVARRTYNETVNDIYSLLNTYIGKCHDDDSQK